MLNRLKYILPILTLFAFTQGEQAFSAPKNNKKAASSKKSTKKASSSKKQAAASAAEEAEEQTPAPAPAPAPVQAKAVQQPVAPVAAPVATYDDAPYDPFAEEAAKPKTAASQKDINVPTDSEWDEFRKCMANQCECHSCNSESIPKNAGCYKEGQFETSFDSCATITIDSSKTAAYKTYFWETYLTDEARKNCEKDKEGTFNPDKMECKINITYIINYKAKEKGIFGKAKETGDCQKSPSKKFALNGRAFVCTHEAFGLADCRMEDPKAAENDMKMIQGIVGTSIAVGGALLTIGVNDGFKRDKPVCTGKQTPEKDNCTETTPISPIVPAEGTAPGSDGCPTGSAMAKDGCCWAGATKGYCPPTPTKTTDKSKDKSDVVSGAIDQGMKGLGDGVSSMLQGGLLKGQGGIATGRCESSDGQVASENNTISLSW